MFKMLHKYEILTNLYTFQDSTNTYITINILGGVATIFFGPLEKKILKGVSSIS